MRKAKVGVIGVLAVLFGLEGCLLDKGAGGGDVGYVAPTPVSATNDRVVDKPWDTLLEAALVTLSQPPFRVGGTDRLGKAIQVFYTAKNPQPYVDCGVVTARLNGSIKDSTYRFEAAKAYVEYKLWHGTEVVEVRRSMSLRATVDLVFEYVDGTTTHLRPNITYELTREVRSHRSTSDTDADHSDSITFKSGGAASFPADKEGRTLDCVATGELETKVLAFAPPAH